MRRRFESWFCDPEQMWWGTWANHLRGWSELAAQHENILFVRFEDLVADLAGQAQRINHFLGGAPLNGEELEQVVEKCSYDYMKRHADYFEMQPPHILQGSSDLFVAGGGRRATEISAAARERILNCCERELGSDHPWGYREATAASG